MENSITYASVSSYSRPLTRRIQREIERVAGLGLLPRALVLGIPEYEELCGLEAVSQGLHNSQPVTVYEECIVFAVDRPGIILALPDVREMWEALERSMALRNEGTV